MLAFKTENVQILIIFNQRVLQEVKNPFRKPIEVQKSTEFHMHHQEIPQPSPYYSLMDTPYSL